MKTSVIDQSSDAADTKVRRYEKVRDKCLAKDPDYYRKIGVVGGKAATGAFKANPDLARQAANKRWSKYRAAKRLQAEQRASIDQGR